MSYEVVENASYCVVEFRDEENAKGHKIEIVNKHWIDRDNNDTKKGVCYFPPAYDYGQVEKWLKNQTTRKSSWEILHVEIFCSAVELESARRRLQRSYKK